MLVLRNSKIEAEEFVIGKKMSIVRPDGMNITLVANINHASSMSLQSIDLTGIQSLQADVVSMQKGSVMEIRIDAPDGAVIAQANIPVTNPDKPAMQHVNIPVKPTTGVHDLYVVFKNNSGVLENIAFIDWMRFNK